MAKQIIKETRGQGRGHMGNDQTIDYCIAYIGGFRAKLAGEGP